jgi:hypothetical protein
MDQPLYDIICTGQLVEGSNPDDAQQKLAQLFKTSNDKVAHFFDGKAHALKRGVDKATALKYKAALHKAGIVVGFKAHQHAAVPNQADTAAVSTPTQPQRDADLTLAPAGTAVLREEERHEFVARDIDTSAINLASPFIEPVTEQHSSAAAPNVSHISMAEVGADLNPDAPPPPPELPLNLDELSLAPAGTELEQLQEKLPPLDPDTSALSMAPAGSDILEGQTKPAPPPAPNTEHIFLSEDKSSQT